MYDVTWTDDLENAIKLGKYKTDRNGIYRILYLYESLLIVFKKIGNVREVFDLFILVSLMMT